MKHISEVLTDMCIVEKNSQNKVSPNNINDIVAKMIKQRLDVGQKKYGGDMPIHDGRDWLKEAIEEVLDLSVYLAAYLVQLKQQRK